MATTIKLKNSVTATNAPSSLVQGEVAINVTDKKVWVGNAATTPIQLLGGGADGSFTNISVSSVATFGAGTVSLPAITTTGDTNTGIFFPAADTIAFSEGGVEAMRINSSGNVGIGTSSPTFAAGGGLQVKNAGFTSVRVSSGSSTGVDFAQATDGLAYMYNRDNNGLVFGTNNTERMRINSSGNVGIGTSSPSSGLEVYRATSTTGSLTDASLMLSTTATTGRKVSIGFGLGGGVANTCAAVIGYDVTNGAGAGLGDIYFSTRNTTADSTPTERMRITSGGDLLVGTTSFSVGTNGISLGSASNSRININNNTDYGIEMYGSTSSRVSFYSSNGSSTRVGAITVNTTNTTYGTSSDYRLKENIAPMTGALAKVQALKPVTYTWKADGSEGQGFIAHELQEVIPDAVVGEKDAVEEDGSIKSQQIDTSFLVATLTAAIQEQQAMIEELKQEVAKLKGV